jgi:predicted nucleic acid-binding protein
VRYLVDTCVLSEWKRRSPDPNVLKWLEALPYDDMFISILSLGELEKGILRLPDAERRAALEGWLRELEETFASHILPLSSGEIRAWAELSAATEAAGATVPAIDGLITATARAHRLAVATRNVGDMLPTGVPLLNPWTGEWFNTASRG